MFLADASTWKGSSERNISVDEAGIGRGSRNRGWGQSTQDIFRSLSRNRECTITVTDAGTDGLAPPTS